MGGYDPHIAHATAQRAMTEASFFSWIGRLLRGQRGGAQQPARWPVIQIEATSRCLMRCSFCPNKMLRGSWQHADLPWEVYRDHIGPHLERFELVYLQGWGEPMLHPDLWSMVRLAKDAGCRVGFTSCGGLLGEENAARLVGEGVDLLSLSFAGASAAVHESLRVGSDFGRLRTNVERLAARRAGSDGSRLHLELHFLMMRPNIHELPAFVRLAAELGADEAVATNLTYAFSPELDAARVFGPEPDPRHVALVEEAAGEARRLGLQFRAYPLAIEPNTVECDAQPTTSAFINCRGQVTPCVYLGMPVAQSVSRYFEGAERPFAPLSFGDVRDGLLVAWEGRPRKTFTAAFARRRTTGYSSLLVSAAGGDAGELPAPPEPCRYCYKLLGV